MNASTKSHPRFSKLRISEAYIATILLFVVVLLSIGVLVKFGPAMPAAWEFVYLIGFSWFVLTPVKTIRVWLKFWPLLLLPGFAVASVMWSADPASTTRTGIQFMFSTLLAIKIGSALSARRAIGCVFAATSIGCVLSIAAFFVPPFQPAFESGDAFVGIYAQKTVAGVALTLFMLSLCAQGAMWNYRYLAAFVAAPFIALLIMTKSISAMVLLSCSAFIIFQGILARWTPERRFSIFMLLLTALAMWIAVLWIVEFDVVAFALDLAGKSTTLTGRTDIWDLGIQVADDYPILGVGYAAFWENSVFAEDWGFLHATVDPRLKGFHNLYIEALATTGIVSVILLVFVYYWTMAKALFWFIESCSVQSAFWLIMIVSALALSFFDNVLFAEHEFFHIAATLAFVFATLERRSFIWNFKSNNIPLQARAV